MPGSMRPNSKSSNRTLKKTASFVLASLRDSTYRKGTPPLFARCGRADGLFEYPAIGAWPLRVGLVPQYTQATL